MINLTNLVVYYCSNDDNSHLTAISNNSNDSKIPYADRFLITIDAEREQTRSEREFADT